MKKLYHEDKLAIPKLGFLFASTVHMMRLMRPETKYMALYDHLFCGSFELFFGGTFVGRHPEQLSPERYLSLACDPSAVTSYENVHAFAVGGK